MFAAIESGVIFEKGSWIDCVFNAITGLTGVPDVARQLHERRTDVHEFIETWDRCPCTDQRAATFLLKQVLEAVGFIDYPRSRVVRVTTVREYESKIDAAMKELSAEIEAGAFDADLKTVLEAVKCG